MEKSCAVAAAAAAVKGLVLLSLDLGGFYMLVGRMRVILGAGGFFFSFLDKMG